MTLFILALPRRPDAFFMVLIDPIHTLVLELESGVYARKAVNKPLDGLRICIRRSLKPSLSPKIRSHAPKVGLRGSRVNMKRPFKTHDGYKFNLRLDRSGTDWAIRETHQAQTRLSTLDHWFPAMHNRRAKVVQWLVRWTLKHTRGVQNSF